MSGLPAVVQRRRVDIFSDRPACSGDGALKKCQVDIFNDGAACREDRSLKNIWQTI